MSIHNFDFRDKDEVWNYAKHQKMLPKKKIPHDDIHNYLVDAIVKKYRKQDLRILFKKNKITANVNFDELGLVRMHYLQTIKVRDQMGHFLPSIQTDKSDEDDDNDDEELIEEVVLDKNADVMVILSTEGRKLITKRLKKQDQEFFTISSYTNDAKLSKKLSVSDKVKISTYFAEKQREIDHHQSTKHKDTSSISTTETDEVVTTTEDKSTSSDDDNSEDMSLNNSHMSDDDDETDQQSYQEHPKKKTRYSSSTSGEGSNSTPTKKRSKSIQKAVYSLTPKKTPKKGKNMISMPIVEIGGKNIKREKGTFSKVNVFVSKAIESFHTSKKYFLIICPEDAKKKQLYSWRADYLEPTLKTIQQDLADGEYMKSNLKIYKGNECNEPLSNDTKQENGYAIKRIVLSISVNEKIQQKLAKEKHDDNLLDEKYFIKSVFEAFYDSFVMDETFETRFVWTLENLYADKPNHNAKYPLKNPQKYKNTVTQYIAREYGSEQMSRNLQRLANPEISYLWDINMADKIIKTDIVGMLEQEMPSSSRTVKQAKKKWAGFDDGF